jgi:hypothetical protein
MCGVNLVRDLLSMHRVFINIFSKHSPQQISHGSVSITTSSLFGWLVADGWCWFVLREEYCWLVAGGWFVLREKYCWLVADKPSEQAADSGPSLYSSRRPMRL